jgi:hypothetical protein
MARLWTVNFTSVSLASPTAVPLLDWAVCLERIGIGNFTIPGSLSSYQIPAVLALIQNFLLRVGLVEKN